MYTPHLVHYPVLEMKRLRCKEVVNTKKQLGGPNFSQLWLLCP